MTDTYDITITRGTGDNYTLSYDLWAKRGSVPEAVGDGEFVGTYRMQANATTVDATFTTNFSGTYYYLIVPRRHYQIGRETLL
jgi:hypothetical protein